MRLLFPSAVTDPDVGGLYAYPDGPAGGSGRSRVRGNMVESVDGAAALDGRSGGLSGDADKAVFRILRSQADVVVAGSGTVTSEHYRPAQASAMVPDLRTGRPATPPADRGHHRVAGSGPVGQPVHRGPGRRPDHRHHHRKGPVRPA